MPTSPIPTSVPLHVWFPSVPVGSRRFPSGQLLRLNVTSCLNRSRRFPTSRWQADLCFPSEADGPPASAQRARGAGTGDCPGLRPRGAAWPLTPPFSPPQPPAPSQDSVPRPPPALPVLGAASEEKQSASAARPRARLPPGRLLWRCGSWVRRWPGPCWGPGHSGAVCPRRPPEAPVVNVQGLKVLWEILAPLPRPPAPAQCPLGPLRTWPRALPSWAHLTARTPHHRGPALRWGPALGTGRPQRGCRLPITVAPDLPDAGPGLGSPGSCRRCPGPAAEAWSSPRASAVEGVPGKGPDLLRVWPLAHQPAVSLPPGPDLWAPFELGPLPWVSHCWRKSPKHRLLPGARHFQAQDPARCCLRLPT